VLESGSILVYLAEHFGAFLPTEPRARTATRNWLMWQMGSAPFVGGGFGHFCAYAPLKIEHAIDRYAMEVKRQIHVLDTHLASNEFLAGNQYTIADMAIWPWQPGSLFGAYKASEFLAVEDYRNLMRWAETIARGRRSGVGGSSNARPASRAHSCASATKRRISLCWRGSSSANSGPKLEPQSRTLARRSFELEGQIDGWWVMCPTGNSDMFVSSTIQKKAAPVKEQLRRLEELRRRAEDVAYGSFFVVSRGSRRLRRRR
jgi:glutathione S-transferase